MPKQIQNPIVGQNLQRAFGLQGRIDPALDEIITPVISIGDLGRGYPPPVLRGAAAAFREAAVAGQYCTWRFEVPGNVLAQIRAVYVRGASASHLRVRFTNTGGAQPNQATPEYTDGRLTDQGLSPAGQLTSGTQAGLLTASTQIWVPTDGLEWTPDHLIVGSGRQGQFGFLDMQLGTVNVETRVTIEWVEYVAV